MATAASDFRTFLQELEEEGDLLHITREVDPHLELGAICRRVYETGEKAPLFENLKGRSGNGLFRILGAPGGVSKDEHRRYGRTAKALGLPSTATGQEIIQRVNEAKHRKPLPIKHVSTGPVKENILGKDEIDLEKLPIGYLHRDDGGRYIQTMGMFIVKAHSGEWVNWSVTRGMIVSKNELVCPVLGGQHIKDVYDLWKKQGKDTPFALCFGVPPAALMVSGMPIPKGVDESDYVGALCGRSIELVKCETNDLLVPANAEIIFEGVICKDKLASEGPMGEYHGHIFPSDKHDACVFRVDTITYRNDPILPVAVAGRCPDETHQIWGIMMAAQVLIVCQEAALPIKMVWAPFEAHCLWFALQVDRKKLVARRTNAKEFCKAVADAVFSTHVGLYIPKVFLVGEDIDPTNLRDVIWAECTRAEPGTNDYIVDTPYSTSKLMPYIAHRDPRIKEPFKKVVKNCMLHYEFTQDEGPWTESSFRGNYPEEVKEKVLENWTGYGFGGRF